MEKKENHSEPKMERDSFVFYSSWIKGIQNFSERKKMEIIYTLVNYCIYGIEPTSNKPHVQMAFNFAKPSIDKNIKRYLSTMERRRQSATQGEHDVNTMSTQGEHDVNTMECVDDNVDVDVNEDDNVDNKKERKKKEFVPPTIEEVKAYMQEYIKEKAEKEKSYLTIGDDDPERFIAHHASGGWIMKNRQVMKNWKQAARTWVLNHNEWHPNHLEERKHTLIQDDSDYGRFNRWLLANTPYVAGHFDSLLSENQFRSLKFSYGTERLTDVLFDLENRHDWCDKCSDLNTTLINWLNKDNGN